MLSRGKGKRNETKYDLRPFKKYFLTENSAGNILTRNKTWTHVHGSYPHTITTK